MIVSHKYKFIFVKTTKTAGTSIQYDLSKHLGGEDILSPIVPRIKGYKERNFSQYPKHVLRSHSTATEIKKVFGESVFDNYFKFCVEREPVDKCISHYSMHKNKFDGFESYIERGAFPIDVGKYADLDTGKLLVDKIIRYENLEEEFNDLMLQLDIPCVITSKAKGNSRVDIEVTDEQRKIIYSAFHNSNKFSRY